MTQLVQLLSEFRAQRLDQAQLLTRAAALLSESGDNLETVLIALQEEHARAPLPVAAFVALRKHLYAASAPKTEALAQESSAAARTEILADPVPKSIDAPPAPAVIAEEIVAKQALGAVLGNRFKLIEFVGAGGTARLYKAIDLRKVEAGADDPHVAVKVLTLPYKDTLDALAVLHRETEGLQALAHPNIVRVIDCDRDGDTVFMTMEFIRGKTLHALMRGSRYLGARREDTLPVIHGIASAVEFAHSKFIVHGDLTPGNVMIANNGAVKVIDFGIARIFGQPTDKAASGQRLNSRGEITGVSPSYASPEMLEFREPDPRDDIYSLACIAWELLAGEHPFGRRNAKAARDEGMKLEYTDKLTRGEYTALARALCFDREKRTPSVHKFIAELTGSRSKRFIPVVAAAAAALVAGVGAYMYFTPAPTPHAGDPVAQVPVAPPLAIAPAPTTSPPEPGTLFRDCPTCPLMTAMPTGEFLQGSPANASGAQSFEMPQHRVRIAKTFATSRTEITVGEFAEFVQATGHETQGCMSYDGEWKLRADVHWKNALSAQTSAHPVSCVSWQDATAYARWLSERTGQSYRLPSASEWEYAARAGSNNDRAWAADVDACTVGNVADQGAATRYPGWTVHNCTDAYVQAAPVGSFDANAFGLHDMLGNVFEWVADCWAENYDGAPTDGRANREGDCSQREMRGGSWFTAPSFVRFAYRNRFASDYRSSSVGFRLVREIAP
jgi:formylglycine-generating enzyme required for sulfatase activity